MVDAPRLPDFRMLSHACFPSRLNSATMGGDRRSQVFEMAHRFVLLVGSVLLACGSPVAAGDQVAPTFAADVRPIIQARCAKCHGEKVRKADLDLTTPAAILKGGESGPAVVPGKPEESLLYEKVHTGAMPPKKEGQLSAAEVETIRRWIAAGAKADTETTTVVETVTQHDVIPILLAALHGLPRAAPAGGRPRPAHQGGACSAAASPGPAIVPGQAGREPAHQEDPCRARCRRRSGSSRRASSRSSRPRSTCSPGGSRPGARRSTIEPDVATTTPDPLVTDKDRDFWAFRPPQAGRGPGRPRRRRGSATRSTPSSSRSSKQGASASRRRPTGRRCCGGRRST